MSQAEAPIRLLYLEPPAGRGPALALPESGALLIGSDPASSNLALPGDDVRANHAAIARLKDGGFGVVSVEGAPLAVNGRATASARLGEGDVLRIGSHDLRVVGRNKAAELRVPERVAGFRIQRRLGSGAMGQVFLAVQESLAREVALKVLRPELAADASFVKRFEAEARAAASLGHPNVVTVYDVGQVPGTAGGSPIYYLAMEYMARGSLEERLAREGPLPPKEVVSVLRDATRGLEYAEARGIVHRDLKPANLMQDGSGVVKIADLGLATQAEAEAEARVFGTAHFAAPEQIRGERADSRADLYSLGASAYRLLTGRTPFQGADRKEILRRVLNEAPTPLAPLLPGAPAELLALVERLLAKDPAARAQSAAHLAREVDSLALRLEHGSLAPLATAGGRRGLWFAGAAAVAALAATGYFVFGGSGEPVATPRAAMEASGSGLRPDAETSLQPDETNPEDTNPGAETTSAASTTSPPAPPVAVGAEDAALRQAELDAEQALARARGFEDPADQRQALAELATRYAGTRAAGEAIAALATPEPSAAPDPNKALDAARAPFVTLLGTAADPGPADGPRTLAEFARGLAGLTVPPALLGDAKTDEAIAAAVQRYAQTARGYVQDGLEAADRAVAAGDFEAFDKGLEQLERWLSPAADAAENSAETSAAVSALAGASEDGEPPPGSVLERALSADLQLRDTLLQQLELDPLRMRVEAARAARRTLELAFEASMAQADRAKLGARFGGAGHLAEQLVAFDLGALAAELEAARVGLASVGETQALTEAAAYLRSAARAFDHLVRAQGNGEWRRQNVPVPNRRTLMASLVRVEAKGMHVAAGSEDLFVPWASFGGRTVELGQLFTQRLAREWTPEESADIGALMTLAAVAELLTQVLDVFDPNVVARLSPLERDEVLAAFDRAVEWIERGGDRGAFDAERRAAWLVTEGLRALDGGDPLVLAWSLEQALLELPHTFVVRALSDGRVEGEPLPWPPADWLPLARPVSEAGAASPAPAPAADGADQPGG